MAAVVRRTIDLSSRAAIPRCAVVNATLPRGIFLGWLSALILYTAVSLALFHAVPWWVVNPLVKSKHAELATTPGLIGLVALR